MEMVLSIIAVIISLLSGGFAVYVFFWTSIRDRKQATLEVYNRLQAEVFDFLNTYTPSEIGNICEDTKSVEYKVISGYLARIEHFCVGINKKIYDENTFYALAHGYFDGDALRKRIEPVIESKNKYKTRTAEIFYNDTISVLMWMDKKSKKGGKKCLNRGN